MKIKELPEEIWQEFEKDRSYKSAIELYTTVETNENFYVGKQWEGVNAPDLDKPVMNILQRVVAYFLSNIVSDDIGIDVSGFKGERKEQAVFDMLTGKFKEVMEVATMKRKYREMLRNAAIDGEGCIHYFFDIEELQIGMRDDEGQTKGVIKAEILENTDVCFGDRQLSDVQEQPFIILTFRRFIEDVKETAKENGQAVDKIVTDQAAEGMNREDEEDKVTVLRKYWKKDGTVFFCEVTSGGMVIPPTDSGYKGYPLVWFIWERIKNSYHGQAAMTGLIPNQIFINKLFAMAMQHVKMMAFPKILYNKSLLPNGWSNRVGEAIAVTGMPSEAVNAPLQNTDMSSQVLYMIDKTMEYTRDTMGASAASLGDIKPDNTSAIIATQKATSMPLELQKQEFYQIVEDSVRIWLDIMTNKYGMRDVRMEIEDEQSGEKSHEIVRFDFGVIKDMLVSLNVEIGATTYWSEIMQVRTLDNLFANGVLTDPIDYLTMIPLAMLPMKQQVIDSVRRSQEKMQNEQLAQMGGEMAIPEGAGEMPPETLTEMPIDEAKVLQQMGNMPTNPAQSGVQGQGGLSNEMLQGMMEIAGS